MVTVPIVLQRKDSEWVGGPEPGVQKEMGVQRVSLKHCKRLEGNHEWGWEGMDLGSAHYFISCLFLRQMNTWFICLNLRCISHINWAMCRILFKKKILSVSSTFSSSPFYGGLSSASTSLYLQLQIKKTDNASMMMNDSWHLAWAWSCQQEVEGWWQARTLMSHWSCSSI